MTEPLSRPPLRFSCSNIAWSDEEEVSAFELLRLHGVTGIEVAPTRIWPHWQGATVNAARVQALRLADAGFEVSSLQALLFEQPAAQLFGADGGAQFEVHLTRIAALGQALGARAAVLGAPRNRQRGALPLPEARARAVPILRRLAQRFEEAGLQLVLEPARPEYGGDFVITTAESHDLVREVDHPGFAVHLDAAAMYSAGEFIETLWSGFGPCLPGHYQLSEPGLGGFERGGLWMGPASERVPHQHNLDFLQSVGWTGWCAIEMRRPRHGLAFSGPWALVDEFVA